MNQKNDRIRDLGRLGINMQGFQRVIALAGNPNTGKSTVFNALTGLRQHTGNWPGKTVKRAEGGFTFRDVRYKLVDLPGTYSLLSASTDEEVARNFVLFGRPDCTLIVVDATALERNLNLAFQVMEITDKAVLCVNLMDEARRKGVVVDVELLSQDLGIPVVPTTARTGEGLQELMGTMADVIEGKVATNPKIPTPPEQLKNAVDELLPMIEQIAPGIPNARWIAYRLLEGDHQVQQALLSGELHRVATYQLDPLDAKAAGNPANAQEVA